ncbi:hypothetical protein H6G20_11020 [Desertifilum sp. FACHB-1129]|uniref:Uncharacterized protein n=2 Tax=Desertifilum tharense IPPAS B-1220 TaxID=1781255 RepID=A0A1E5QE22_9CYAN|nr:MULTISPECIES: hypothetical protein [Desertifilum]MCD8487698.1 hypothetical protein [Desertifilum sp.]MDA0211686.1 hypothetical protein [Cyanobacteria bacterium FC1]MBD2312193.1 hypothetical protein [Desertifilum sp. FACHB-1129]MBD2322145.1 hypothetical protein [Desertifilum sp. FACHB-866]MBD2332182.1 hypothetical protein [Desertifilum sp. FACHB-868]
MDIQRPNAQPLSPDDELQLSKLKATIERAIADGKITSQELQSIKAVMWADGKVMPQELDLIRTLIHEKIAKDELIYEWY